ncbi:replication-associated recombination protein A [Oligoflexaceae bacterium]|nr:replication-associated recombination protein A [Oligoflexaceae bacterium]
MNRPLPEKRRPISAEQIIGQQSIWNPNSRLYQMVERSQFHSLLFWGPPGTGKTSLARVIANASGLPLEFLSAVSSGVKDIRKVIEKSQSLFESENRQILLFMDELHRLSKSQQDVLLPVLESGDIKFIGATTENPSFEVNRAILSRLVVFQFKSILATDLEVILQKALESDDLPKVDISSEVLAAISKSANGDARQALNLLDAVIHSRQTDRITLDDVKSFLPSVLQSFDKSGDSHFDTISAFIKSIRASHPDAALHYLAKMIESGESPDFIARRLIISASEDIGNANPNALILATSAAEAARMVGFPEARIILAQVTTYLSASPKSNRSYLGIDSAIKDVRENDNLNIPLHLKNAPTAFMKNIGNSKGYVYPHDDLDSARKLKYMPHALSGRTYYQPSQSGVEKQLKQNLETWRPQAD